MSLVQPVDELRSRLLAEALRNGIRPTATTAARAREAQLQAMIGHRLAAKGKLEPAIERFERAARLDPHVATTHRDLARAYGQVGRLEDALTAFQRAVGLDPDLADAQLGLAELLDFLGRGDEARAAYAALVRLDSANHAASGRLAAIEWKLGRLEAAQAHYRAAATAARAAGAPAAALYDAYADLAAGRIEAAESRLREALATDPANAAIRFELGRVLVEGGRMEDAAASLDEAVALDSRLSEAWVLLAHTRRFEDGDRAKIARMAANLRRTDLSEGQRRALLFALGKVSDDVGDYADAIGWFDRANAARGVGQRLDRQRLERQTSDLIAGTPPGFLAAASGGVDDATPILILGMPRSGTTLVEQILSNHPDVAAGGELTFWRDANVDEPAGAQGAAPNLNRLAGDYLAVLRAISPDARRVTDKMPYNFWRLGLIRRAFPRATIIHCRRSPTDTCLSIYQTDFAFPDDFVSDRGDLVFYYRQYQRLMAHWRRVLPADHFIEVEYESLVADPERSVRGLVAGCGLEWRDACLAPQLNRRPIATASLWQARQPIHRGSVGRWRRYEAWLGELRALAADEEPCPRANSDRRQFGIETSDREFA